ncbi:TetR/AcrR family transcriptional regulator [Lachnoclostridium phytofermentans]|uniref:TetR/AcrR family transcriptional regulator n=1 Tax=Lachnoclostridium phytofermentans TaxID=66219 RepID=UPI0004955563|nr:TetR/AcrR family transcriptional regulator [Lachnoclostridium phytofermentans]
MTISTSVHREQERLEQKEKRKNEILNVARELFITKGLSENTMDNIASEIKITRRTLYRYYKTKEELAFEIEIMLFEELYYFQTKIYKTLVGNGLKKIELFLNEIASYVEAKPSIIRFSGVFDFYFTGEYPYLELTNRFKNMISSNDYILEQLIRDGIEDGSIRLDIDPVITGLTISNVLLSLSQRVLIREKHLDEEQGVASREMIRHQFKLFIYSLERK